jgi:hypothetical protein
MCTYDTTLSFSFCWTRFWYICCPPPYQYHDSHIWPLMPIIGPVPKRLTAWSLP